VKMFSSNYVLLLPLLLLPLVSPIEIRRRTPSWPHPYWDIPGDYCRAKYPAMDCCSGRQDRCSVPILGTLCYCDTFCNRTENADCCPDYYPHCLGSDEPQYYEQKAPEPLTIPRPQDCAHGVLNISNPMCEYKGRSYSDRDTIRDNCNTCSCQVSKVKPGCMEVLCSTDQCLVEESVLQEVREGEEGGLYSWRPSNYSDFWGRTLEDGVNGKLGSLTPQPMLQHMSAIHFSYEPASLPTRFDARQEWPGLISRIENQGWCSSSWALATAAVAGDRLSIGKARRIDLSSQCLLSCDTAPQGGCQGGHVDRAWGFLRHHGSWPKRCMPYSAADGQVEVCPARSPCPGQEVQMQPAYRVGRMASATQPRRREQDIMHEIRTQGPVEAVMEVYTDFFMYASGVYQKTNLARGVVAGYHAVRIIGWGQDGGDRYWLVANSWGEQWGEGGLFKIARGSNECQIEEFVLGAWPQQKKPPGGRRRRRRRHRRRGEHSLRRTRHGRRPSRPSRERERHVRPGKHYFQVG